MKTFFISYNSNDEAWALWLAKQVEGLGYTTVIQALDFHAGGNFVHEMHKAAAGTERTLIVLSPNYLNAEYTYPEWEAAFARDPKGDKRLLVPVRIAECKPEGLLAALIYIDLVNLDESAARERLRIKLTASVTGERPNLGMPGFPGAPSSSPDTAPPPPAMPQNAATPYQMRGTLMELLNKRMLAVELKDLAFRLGVDGLSEHLAHADYARQVLEYLEKHGMLADLHACGQAMRPDLPWPSALKKN